jgi:hypothetical protein
MRDHYEDALLAYQANDLNRAKTLFAALADEGDEAANMAMKRAIKLIENPPAKDWDGVTDLTSK